MYQLITIHCQQGHMDYSSEQLFPLHPSLPSYFPPSLPTLYPPSLPPSLSPSFPLFFPPLLLPFFPPSLPPCLTTSLPPSPLPFLPSPLPSSLFTLLAPLSRVISFQESHSRCQKNYWCAYLLVAYFLLGKHSWQALLASRPCIRKGRHVLKATTSLIIIIPFISFESHLKQQHNTLL